jgi:hypothetical protein
MVDCGCRRIGKERLAQRMQGGGTGVAPKGSSSGLEMIAVAIDGRVCTTYAGLAGTFAGFADCCIRRKTLPVSTRRA